MLLDGERLGQIIKSLISKSPTPSDVHVSSTGMGRKKKPKLKDDDPLLTDRRRLPVTGMTLAAQAVTGQANVTGGGSGSGKSKSMEPMSGKRDWSVDFAIKKTVADQNLVFGWASIVEKDGETVVDKQNEIILAADLEKAVYEYVLFKRVGGEMHESHAGPLVESLMLTAEKREAMGIGDGPLGWWVGYKVAPEIFAKVKDGTYKMFSIGGGGVREKVSDE